jgi:metal-dependent HD superfamily phosphatase/phosphodiesterase
MQWDSEYHTVVLTVPLHDVGKFVHRGKFLYHDKRQHLEFSVLLAPRTGGGREIP